MLKGNMPALRLPTTVKTRPCISGATAPCITAVSEPLQSEFITPPKNSPPSAMGKRNAGVTPTTRKPSPRPTMPTMHVIIRRLKPPNSVKSSPPPRRPTPHADSSQPSCSASPLK